LTSADGLGVTLLGLLPCDVLEIGADGDSIAGNCVENGLDAEGFEGHSVNWEYWRG
jgi:hypothetical protein